MSAYWTRATTGARASLLAQDLALLESALRAVGTAVDGSPQATTEPWIWLRDAEAIRKNGDVEIAHMERAGRIIRATLSGGDEELAEARLDALRLQGVFRTVLLRCDYWSGYSGDLGEKIAACRSVAVGGDDEGLRVHTALGDLRRNIRRGLLQ